MNSALLAQVDELIRDVARRILLPYWRNLAHGDIEAKQPDDFVTVADRAAEVALTHGLLSIRPDARVVGEEAVSADPSLLSAMQHDGAVWIIDPIDGTHNFIDGAPTFAVMVALMQAGQVTDSWIFQPATDAMYRAHIGQGATRNGTRLVSRAAPSDLALMHVGISVRYTPEPLRGHVMTQLHRFASHAPFMCAGFEYAALADGHKSMAMFHRLLPWDHAPGLLLAQEAGLVVRHFDGSTYAAQATRTGLIVAASDAVWQQCRDLLVPETLRV